MTILSFQIHAWSYNPTMYNHSCSQQLYQQNNYDEKDKIILGHTYGCYIDKIVEVKPTIFEENYN